MRRGMYRPVSSSSQAATSSDRNIVVVSFFRVLSDMFLNGLHFDLPPFRGGHAGAICVASHQMARRRPVGNEDHPLRHFPFDAFEGDFAVLGAHTNITSGLNANLFHVL